MEPKAAYDAGPAELPLTCPDCDAVIGTITQIDRRAWLIVGGLRLNSISGMCGCGKVIRWNSADVPFEHMIERAQKRRLSNPANGL